MTEENEANGLKRTQRRHNSSIWCVEGHDVESVKLGSILKRQSWSQDKDTSWGPFQFPVTKQKSRHSSAVPLVGMRKEGRHGCNDCIFMNSITGS